LESELHARIEQLYCDLRKGHADLCSQLLQAQNRIQQVETSMDIRSVSGHRTSSRAASPARITSSNSFQRPDSRKPHFNQPEHPTDPKSRDLTLKMEQEILAAMNKTPEEKRNLVKRRLPKDAHPDRGGTHQAFQWLDDWTKEHLKWYLGPGILQEPGLPLH